MLRLFARNIVRFFVVVLIQVLVLDNINLSGYMNPLFYIVFILLMPFETPKWLILAGGFLLGLSVDLFSNTLGMHTGAAVFIAFLRPWVLSIIAPRDGYEPDTFPRIYYYGFKWFAIYTLILTFLHHTVLFYLEVFNFHDFLSTFLRVVLSTFLTALTIILSQYFIFRK
jgi:rod shape-determining protein MreD